MAYQAASTAGVTYTHNIKKLLEQAMPKMPLANAAQTRTVPLNSGYTAKFTRWLQVAVPTSALSETAVASQTAPTAQSIECTVARWGLALGMSTLMDDTFINPAVTGVMGILGINAGMATNLEMQKQTAANSTTDDVGGMIAYVYDSSQLSTNNLNSTCTSAGSTTSAVDTARTESAEDVHKGGWITFTNPQEKNYGLMRKVLAFDATADALYWTTAVNVATSTSTTYRLGTMNHASASTLTAGSDVYSGVAARNAMSILDKHMVQRFEDGYCKATLCPDSQAHFVSDTSTIGWVDISKYASQKENLLTGEIGRYMGARYYMDTHPFTVDNADGFPYAAGDEIFCDFIVGANSIARTGLSGQTDTQYVIKRSEKSNSVYDATNNLNTAAWLTSWARLSLNACHTVGIITRPTQL